MNSPPTSPGTGDRTERILTDLLTFGDEISAYVTSPGAQNFFDDRQTQLVTEALLHRLGEAVARLDEDFIAAHPEVEWLKMKRMRNVVAHEYGFIDYRIVWRALNGDLPRDVDAIRRILDGA